MLFKDLNYTIDKLQYAIFKNNNSSADFYFKKLQDSDESSISYFKSYQGDKTISNYYAFKNNYKKSHITYITTYLYKVILF